jgi:hypothetical protein
MRTKATGIIVASMLLCGWPSNSFAQNNQQGSSHKTKVHCSRKAATKPGGKNSKDCQSADTTQDRGLPANAQLVLTEDGGFAYRHNEYHVDFSTLSKDTREKLSEAVTGSGLQKIAEQNNTNKAAADVITYTFTLKVGASSHVATFDDTTLTPEFRKLIDVIKHSGVKPQTQKVPG